VECLYNASEVDQDSSYIVEGAGAAGGRSVGYSSPLWAGRHHAVSWAELCRKLVVHE